MTRRSAGRALAFGMLVLMAKTAIADPPSILSVRPLGVPKGSSTEVTITGANLGENPRFIAPFGVVESLTKSAEGGKWALKLTVAPETAIGVYPIRVRTDDGLSNPALIAVGQVPQVAEAEDNSVFESAQKVPTPVVVEGSLAGADVDYFKFSGKKGERIVVDAQCARIGSGVDPQIRLTTAARGFVAASDDAPGLLTDARLTIALPEDGDYVLEISDTKYQGGAKPVYRLLIGVIPVAEEIYPLGGRRNESVVVELRGGTIGEMKTTPVVLSAPPEVEALRLKVTGSMLGMSDSGYDLDSANPMAVSDMPEHRESPDPAAAPTKAAAPGVFNGRIDPAGDEDRFVVAVEPNATYRIAVSASDLGSALDGTLSVMNEKGNVLASADDTVTPVAPAKGQKTKPPGLVSPDPSLTFKVPADVRELTLSLRDLEGRGGVGFPYRIAVEPVSPEFHLALNDSEVSIPAGGSIALGVTVARQGYNGPITLSIADPPAGISFRPGLVPDGQGVGSLTVSAAPGVDFGPVSLKVIGTGQGPSGPITDLASKQVVFSQIGPMPTNVSTFHGLPAAPSRPSAITLDSPSEPIEVAHGTTSPIPIKATRQAGMDGPLTFLSLPIPFAITVPGGAIAEKALDGSATVVVPVEAPLGPLNIAVLAKGNFLGKERAFAAPELSIVVVRPASIELAAPAFEIKPGASFELKGKLLRKGAFREPVKVALTALPAGLKSEPITVAADSAEFTLKVDADPKAAAAEAKSLVTIAFQINKKDYATPPTEVAVKVVP